MVERERERCKHSNSECANLRIRKLTPKECLRLMGFEDKDYESLVNVGLTDSAIYHCAGDSIITTCLISLIGSLTDLDYEKIVENYVERVKENDSNECD